MQHPEGERFGLEGLHAANLTEDPRAVSPQRDAGSPFRGNDAFLKDHVVDSSTLEGVGETESRFAGAGDDDPEGFA